ncbi:MAG: hypothetical protein L6Q97_14650 [Thermoanaerobaculia bacterium]|nr:hypothetical protein [Thermoanaerobaculia bacterium]
MNKRFFFCILLVWTSIALTSFGLQAQKSDSKTQSGLYLTAEDYQNGKLTLPDTPGKSHKIRLKDFWGSRYLEVEHEGQKYRFHKDSIYAYQDDKGKVFRFFKTYSNEYRLLENKGLVIYSMEVTDTRGKGVRRNTLYFFSTTLTASVLPLTMENVKNAFPENHGLHNELDKYFKGDKELAAYDGRHSMFRINHVLGSILSQH